MATALVLEPFVSEANLFMVRRHAIFQGYHFFDRLGFDRNARDRFKDSPYYEDCKRFCHNYDQNAFDPNYESKPLEFFEPMMRHLFARNPCHMELTERADDNASRQAAE